jgi:hypothetical protein
VCGGRGDPPGTGGGGCCPASFPCLADRRRERRRRERHGRMQPRERVGGGENEGEKKVGGLGGSAGANNSDLRDEFSSVKL